MTPGWADDWRACANLLCVRLDSMGDVLMTEPALRALKQGLPGRRLTLLTSPAGAEAARLLPEVDEVLVYRAPWMKTETDGPAVDLAFIEELRARGFDGAAVFTVYSQNPLPAALSLYLAGIPRRLAYCRENPYHLVTHWLREREPEQLQRHEVQRQLDLVAAIGCKTEDVAMRLCVSEAHRLSAGSRLGDAGIDRARPWIVVHPGASAPSRRYPVECFVAALYRLRREYGLQVLLTGSAQESELLEEVRAGADLPPRCVVPDLNLGELAAVIEAAPLLLSNNTGPVHIAAAVGTPVVDLYALTNPQHTPWRVPSRVLSHAVPCQWCYSSVCPEGHHACLELVQPDEVVRAVMGLLAEGRHPSPNPLPDFGEGA